MKTTSKHPLISKWLELLKERKYKTLSQQIYQFILSIVYKMISHNGTKIMSEKWDYLIILDACRYDVFEMVNDIPGRLEKRVSLGSSTLEWAKKNFTDYYEDVIYVSANPYISHVEFDGFRGSDHFFKVINVWDFGWSKELNTVPPWEVYKAAIKARIKYLDKRLIIHFMQPHAPWIGKIKLSGREIRLSYNNAVQWVRKGGIWEKVMDELNISLRFVRRAYVENLKCVLKYVKKLVNQLDGTIVITADHGECLGEHFLIEHPEGIYVRELVEVPWLVIDKPRRETAEEVRMLRRIRKLKEKLRTKINA